MIVQIFLSIRIAGYLSLSGEQRKLKYRIILTIDSIDIDRFDIDSIDIGIDIGNLEKYRYRRYSIIRISISVFDTILDIGLNP